MAAANRMICLRGKVGVYKTGIEAPGSPVTCFQPAHKLCADGANTCKAVVSSVYTATLAGAMLGAIAPAAIIEPSGAVLANSPEQAGEGCESRRVAPEDTPAAVFDDDLPCLPDFLRRKRAAA